MPKDLKDILDKATMAKNEFNNIEWILEDISYKFKYLNELFFNASMGLFKNKPYQTFCDIADGVQTDYNCLQLEFERFKELPFEEKVKFLQREAV